MAKRRVPLHLLPSDLWVYAPAKSKGRGKAFLEDQKDRRALIRQARRTVRLVVGDVAVPAPLDHPLIPELLPLQKKRKPRGTGGKPGRRRKKPELTAAKIRALKDHLRASDADIGVANEVSRSTIARRKK